MRTIGRYELRDVIGRGGAAIVYRAFQSDLERDVALKELAPAEVGDPTFARRFMRESRLIGSLSHPNIVTVFEYFEHESVPYIAMEYVPGGSLRAYERQVTLRQIAGLLEGVLAGLAHGQGQGIVHRDLKPENLLITPDGRVKIADFGIAKAYSQAVTSNVTVTGTTVGTPTYMAPEQALGQPLGPATDLYSLGVITWELLASRSPFADTETPVAILYRHVHETFPSISSVKPETDAELSGWVERMLAKAPAERFESADLAWEALEEIIVRLEGPLWRRTARLGPPARVAEARPLTPAPFTQAGLSETVPDYSPASEEPSTAKTPSPVAADDPANLTVAPRLQRAPVLSTVHRVLRRHVAEPPPPEPAQQTRRRAFTLLGLALGVIAAVALGVLVGQSGGAGRPTRVSGPATIPSHTPALSAESAAALTRVVQAVAAVRNGGLRSMAKAKTPQEQAAAARVIADGYGNGASRISGLATTISSTSTAQSLRTTLLATSSAYSALAKAAARHSQTAYRSATVAVGRDEAGLRRQIAQIQKAARGS